MFRCFATMSLMLMLSGYCNAQTSVTNTLQTTGTPPTANQLTDNVSWANVNPAVKSDKIECFMVNPLKPNKPLPAGMVTATLAAPAATATIAPYNFTMLSTGSTYYTVLTLYDATGAAIGAPTNSAQVVCP